MTSPTKANTITRQASRKIVSNVPRTKSRRRRKRYHRTSTTSVNMGGRRRITGRRPTRITARVTRTMDSFASRESFSIHVLLFQLYYMARAAHSFLLLAQYLWFLTRLCSLFVQTFSRRGTGAIFPRQR